MIRLLISSILAVALTGCGEVVVFGHVVRENPSKTEAAASNTATAPAAPEAAPAATSTQTIATVVVAPAAAHLLHAVNVTVSPASQTTNVSVDAAALLDAIRTELRSRNLLDEQNPSANGTAEVLIESATAHATVNAVIFGQRPMAGTLTGEVHLSSASGEELVASRIVAESRFTITDDGQGPHALGPLYRRFAVLTADELTAAKPNNDAGIQSQTP